MCWVEFEQSVQSGWIVCRDEWIVHDNAGGWGMLAVAVTKLVSWCGSFFLWSDRGRDMIVPGSVCVHVVKRAGWGLGVEMAVVNGVPSFTIAVRHLGLWAFG